ncbi:hypothetical protein WNZ15_20010 [Roseibium sp. AS2]|uniref:hypothetical protein n=1 Tax=Roseibium sp. AS2 TaxID=3135781 RepID=UPI00317BCD81
MIWADFGEPGLLEAFEQGKRAPANEDQSAPLRQFSEALWTTVSARLPRHECQFVKHCAQWHKDTLQAARSDDLAKAQRLSREIWKVARSRALSPLACMLMDVFLPPADAYLAYRLGDYEGARALLLKISALDETLVGAHGLPLLSVHRLQLCHNLMRVHTRLSENGAAARLGAMLLDYIEFRIDPVAPELVSRREVLDCASTPVLSFYFDKICGEIAVALAQEPADSAAGLFRLIRAHGSCGVSEFAPFAHKWIGLKEKALRGELAGFRAAVIPLLRGGRSTEPLLWYAAIIEVITVARTFDDVPAQAFAERLARAATDLPDAPWIMAAILDQPVARQALSAN